jgi:hypothetical protein
VSINTPWGLSWIANMEHKPVREGNHVILIRVDIRGRILATSGLVDSTKGGMHHVQVYYDLTKRYPIKGSCDCEGSVYYGVCSHQLRLLFKALSSITDKRSVNLPATLSP